MKQLFTPLFLLIFSLSFSQITTNSSTGRIIDIDTDFSFRLTDKQYDRPILQSGWLSGIGDYLSIKHGGGNTEENTFGLRISDGYGFDFGKNNFTTSFFKIKTNGYVGIGIPSPTEILEVLGTTKINAIGTRGSAILKLDRGVEGKDVAVVSFGQNGNYNWHTGHLYNGGGLTPDFYISQSQDIRNGSGQIVHNPELTITTSGNIGVGTTNPISKLQVNGDFFLNSSTSSGGWGTTNFYWKGHSLIMGSAVGRFAHNKIELKPGGSSSGELVSILSLYHALNENVHEERIKLDTNKNNPTFFNVGNVGIGTTNPDSKLTVKGKIHAEEVKIDLSFPAPDYVFTKDYDLLTIEEVQQHITEKGHLPNIPSAKELEANGVELGVMNMKLLEKIEELTLYTIAQEKELKAQQKEIELLKQQNTKIEALEAKLELLLSKQ